MKTLKSILSLCLATLIGLGLTNIATAKEWPNEKRMRVVVPYPPGGTVDNVGRLIAKTIGEKKKVTTIVENISGGGTVPASLSVLKDKADGYNLYLASDMTLNISQQLLKKPHYDGNKDFDVVTVIHTLPHWLIVNKDSEFETFEEFFDYIKNNPGKVSISVNGIGGSAYLAVSQWKKDNDLDFEIIPYRGSPPAVVDLIAGVTDAHIDVVGSSIGYYKNDDKDSSTVKPLTVLQPDSLEVIPEVPTLDADKKENLIIIGAQSIVVKAGTPKEIIDQLYELIKESVQEEAFNKQLVTFGLEPILTSPEESQKFIDDETVRYKKLIELSGLPKQ